MHRRSRGDPPPTAAGIVPAVIAYYRRFEPGASDAGIVRFLLVAGDRHALQAQCIDFRGRDGCQGEVGVACSMAAAASSRLNGPTTGENAAKSAWSTTSA